MKYLLLSVILVIFNTSCQKSTEPIDDLPPPGIQEDIPWPSLADSPWPMAHNNPQNTGRSKLWGPSSGVISWEFNEAYKMFNSVVVGPDSIAYILIPPADGGLYAFNPDGTLKWNLNILTVPKLYTTPIITADGTIFCYDGNNIVHAVDPTGIIKYSFELESATNNKSFIIDKEGNFYYVDVNKTLYIIDQNGNIKWTLQDERFNTFSTYLSFSPDGNTIYVLSNSDMLLAVDINAKQVLWSFQDDIIPGESFMRPVDGVVVDSYGNLYLLTQRDYNEGELFVFRPNGEIKWRYKFNTEDVNVNGNVPTIDKQGNIYCATDSVYSFDFNGNLRWKTSLDNISDCPLVSDNNGSVYVGTMGVSIIGFDTDGNQLWRIDDNQDQVGGSPAIGFGEIMYFPTWSSQKLYGIK